jgi:diguanylate cyclase (GGDEF)-like protein/PAS domain S-box-containing protein
MAVLTTDIELDGLAAGDHHARLLADTLDALPERVVRYTFEDRLIVHCNRAWATGHGMTPDDLIGRRIDDLLTGSELEGLRQQLTLLGPANPLLNDPMPRPAPEAPHRWVSWVDQFMRGALGDEVLSVGRDVTDWYEAELQLARNEARFRAMVDGSADVVFCFALTPQPHFSYMSPSVEKLIGYSPKVLEDDLGFFLDIIDEDGRALVLSALAGEPIPERFDVHFRCPDGRIVIGEMQITLSREGLQGIGRDVTEIRALQAELVALALRDPLTGLANRRLLDELLTRALQSTQRSGGELTVAFLDLDGFKTVNDTYGHEAGDEVLREVVRRMLSTVRAADVVARVGGDEFVIVYESADEGSAALVTRVNEVLSSPIDLARGVTVRCPASIGEADTRSTARDAAALLAAADAAMYEVKRSRQANRTA